MNKPYLGISIVGSFGKDFVTIEERKDGQCKEVFRATAKQLLKMKSELRKLKKTAKAKRDEQ